jgi:hypothetical protein
MAVHQARPVDLTHENAPRLRLSAFALLPANDNDVGHGRWPVCKGPASLAANGAEYHGKGLIQHHWQCSAWFTVPHVSE